MEHSSFEKVTGKEKVQSVGESFVDACFVYDEKKPNFSKLKEVLKKINEEIRAFQDDFSILLGESSELGGGLEHEHNKERIVNMKNAVPDLKKMVEEAELIMESDQELFGPYKSQLEAAQKIVSILETL